jgi:hypothetical protein
MKMLLAEFQQFEEYTRTKGKLKEDAKDTKSGKR